MSINVQNKGKNGEREVATALNAVVNRVLKDLGYEVPDTPVIQRRQNQSAVGGKDLDGTFGLAIEIKRQEQLSVNTWWKQCVASAQSSSEHPVLLFRQNRKPWRCITYGWLTVPGGQQRKVRVELTWPEFLAWFEARVRALL